MAFNLPCPEAVWRCDLRPGRGSGTLLHVQRLAKGWARGRREEEDAQAVREAEETIEAATKVRMLDEYCNRTAESLEEALRAHVDAVEDAACMAMEFTAKIQRWRQGARRREERIDLAQKGYTSTSSTGPARTMPHMMERGTQTKVPVKEEEGEWMFEGEVLKPVERMQL